MKIQNYKLTEEGIDFQLSPNKSERFGNGNLDTIVIHYTAGGSRASSVKTLTNPSKKASAHLVIGRDKKITQLVPFDTIAWHAGNSQHNNRIGLNKYSIGIEIDNAGLLSKSGDKYLSWFGKSYNEDEVIQSVHRNQSTSKYWHSYTEWQIETCKEICELLIEQFDIKYILGHEEISPNRKIDPGPAFPLDKFREKIFASSRSENGEDIPIIPKTGKVTSSSLNFRIEPDVESDKITKALPKGTLLEILEEKDGWYKVKTDIEGWVYAKHVK